MAKSIDSANFNDEQITFLNQFNLLSGNIDWNEANIQEAIKKLISDSKLPPRQAFTTLYQSLLNMDRGPKLAPLLVELGKDDVISLLDGLN